MSKEAMKLALEALEWNYNTDLDNIPACEQWAKMLKETITALRTALAEPEQEPVCWQWLDTANYRKKLPANAIPEHWRPLYTAPTPRRPLTEGEMPTLFVGGLALNSKATTEIVRAVEKAHGIGEQHGS